METKVCGLCNLEFPKTEEYFYKRTIKQQTKKGIVIYDSFKSTCKVCFCYNSRARHKKNYAENKEKELNRCKLYRQKNIEKVRLTVRNSYRKNIDSNKLYDKKRTQELPDALIANRLGLKLNECDKEVIKTRRLIIQLKRELKNNNVKIR
jgi:hypothetical protein